MKKAISLFGIAFAALFLLGIGSVSATTEIWTSYVASGSSSYEEHTTAGGTDWQRTGDTTAGGWHVENSHADDFELFEEINNEGHIAMDKYLNAPTRDGSNWDLQEIKHISGDGTTILVKSVQWKTNTRATGTDGKLAYPTVMKVDIDFATPHFYDYESFEATADTSSNWDVFNKYISTNDNFDFTERIGKNMDLI